MSEARWLQVATDTRLWLVNALKQTRQYLADLVKAAAARSETEARTLLAALCSCTYMNVDQRQLGMGRPCL